MATPDAPPRARRDGFRTHERWRIASGRMPWLRDSEAAPTGSDIPVFCDTQGGCLQISNLHRNSLTPLLRKANLPLTTNLYTPLYTCATLLLLAGEPATVVSERPGRSSVTLTLGTYSRDLSAMQKRVATTSRVLNSGGLARK